MKRALLFGLIPAIFIISVLSASAQEMQTDHSFSVMGFTGFGWSNNLRTEDWQNAGRDWAKTAEYGFNPGYTEEEEKGTFIYGGFDLEPRYFSGNLVYALSLGYHKTTTGERNLSGTQRTTNLPLTYHSEASLSLISLLGTVYYKVNKSDSSFFLLGGGFGYYSATLELQRGFNDDIESYEGNGWTIGWHAQLEYNKTLGNVAFAGGVMSRFAEVWKLDIDDDSGNEVYDSGASISGIYFYVGAGYLI